MPPVRSKKIPTNRREDSEPGGKIKYDEASQIMSGRFQEHKSEFSESDRKNLRESRELIIKSIMNGVSTEEAFSRALKNSL